MWRWVLLVLAVAGPAAAQDVVYYDDATVNCVNGAADAADKRRCIGASASQCMEQTEGGYSTIAMGGCIDLELQFWDDVLNVNYRHAKTRAAQADRDNGSGRVLQDALRDMQRAWIPYRDAACAYEYAQWGGGTGGGPAIAACLMQQTARQAMYLDEAWLGE